MCKFPSSSELYLTNAVLCDRFIIDYVILNLNTNISIDLDEYYIDNLK